VVDEPANIEKAPPEVPEPDDKDIEPAVVVAVPVVTEISPEEEEDPWPVESEMAPEVRESGVLIEIEPVISEEEPEDKVKIPPVDVKLPPAEIDISEP